MRRALLGTILAIGLAIGAASAEPMAIGRVNNSVGGHCTGVLVARQIVITAAHCLYNRRTHRWLRPEAIHVLLGYDRGGFAFHSVAQSYEPGDAYDPERPIETLADDWALVQLAAPAPDGIAPLAIEATLPHEARALVPTGFARARPHILTEAEHCTGSVAGRFLVSNCAVPEGFSGGPLLVPGTGTFAGISVATGADRSLAIPGAVLQRALDAPR